MNPYIVMPVYMRSEEDFDITWRTVETIRETIPEEITIALHDDGSPYREGVENLQWKFRNGKCRPISILAAEDNQGFARTVNNGLRTALVNGLDAVLVNADMEFIYSGWLEALYEADADVAGGLLTYPNGLIQHAGIYYSVLRRGYDHRYHFAPGDLPAAHHKVECPVTGALQLIKHETLKEVGIYDPDFKMGYEDVDYCLRVFFSGRKCVYTPGARAIHHESVFRAHSSLDEWHKESAKRLANKYEGRDISFMTTMLEGQVIKNKYPIS